MDPALGTGENTALSENAPSSPLPIHEKSEPLPLLGNGEPRYPEQILHRFGIYTAQQLNLYIQYRSKTGNYL